MNNFSVCTLFFSRADPSRHGIIVISEVAPLPSSPSPTTGGRDQVLLEVISLPDAHLHARASPLERSPVG